MSDKILINATTLTNAGLQRNGQAIAIVDGRIAWCGAVVDLPVEYAAQHADFEDCCGQLITPGLIDCHTHLVYAGNRADEFRQRLQGTSYADIARAGGGILSTVRDTRAASEQELLEQSLPRILALRSEGVTTVEIKSGYGLDLPAELKMLRVARQLGKLAGLRVKTTFLGAHAVPVEFNGRVQDYVDYLCSDMLPAVIDLADAVDVFCESIAFSLAQTEQIFIRAKELGLPLKCHAEQLSNLGASRLAAEMGALSCDHLEYLDERGADAMAEQGSIAVLLPGAFYFLRETRQPPIALLRERGIKIAVATDCNPGSSPTTSLLLMMSMACRFFQLTVPEALTAVTIHAAAALGLSQETGVISPGLAADLVRWAIDDSSALCYYFASPLPHETMVGGQWITKEKA